MKIELIYQQNQVATAPPRYFCKNRRKGFAKKRLKLLKSKEIRASTNRCTDEVRVFYRIRKKQTHIFKEPNLDRAPQIYLSKLTRGFFKIHPKTFLNKENKYCLRMPCTRMRSCQSTLPESSIEAYYVGIH